MKTHLKKEILRNAPNFFWASTCSLWITGATGSCPQTKAMGLSNVGMPGMYIVATSDTGSTRYEIIGLEELSRRYSAITGTGPKELVPAVHVAQVDPSALKAVRQPKGQKDPMKTGTSSLSRR